MQHHYYHHFIKFCCHHEKISNYNAYAKLPDTLFIQSDSVHRYKMPAARQGEPDKLAVNGWLKYSGSHH